MPQLTHLQIDIKISARLPQQWEPLQHWGLVSTWHLLRHVCAQPHLSEQALSLMFTLPFSYSVTPWTVARQAPLSFTTSQSLLKLMPTESVMLSNHLILFYPLFHLSSIFPSIRVFSNESALHIMWPKYWNFSFSTGSSDGYSGLISFRINWLEGKRRTFWGVGHTMGHSRS